MDYTELLIPVDGTEQAEIAVALLAELPYESFDDNTEGQLRAYIQSGALTDGVRRATAEALADGDFGGWSFTEVAPQNWNAAWEQTFVPVIVDHRAIIRAAHHEPRPDYPVEIVITPRMAFGSGSHATTSMLVAMILDMTLEGLHGADIGCGTGVLAIAAAKCGAAHMDAVDIDDAAVDNAVGNVRDNGLEGRIDVMAGTVGRLDGRRYDFIFANINRNILINDMPAYAAALRTGGRLLVSGFYEDDLAKVAEAALACGVRLTGSRTCNGWTAAEFCREG